MDMKALRLVLLGIAFILFGIYSAYVGNLAELNFLAPCALICGPAGIIMAIIGALKKD